MESKFPERVALERRALDAVNGSRLFSHELVGVSMACITAWLEQIESALSTSSRQSLLDALVDVSYACHAEADISDEIFHDIDPSIAGLALARLEAVLKDVLVASR